MKYLLIAVALFAVCSPKTYVTPEIGMTYTSDFFRLCGMPDDSRTVTTDKGVTFTVINKQKDRPIGCNNGTFIFVDNKLTSITR